MRPIPPPFGLNVIGHASTNLGLGNTLRQHVNCFIAREKKVHMLDVHAGVLRSEFDNSFQHLTDGQPRICREPVHNNKRIEIIELCT